MNKNNLRWILFIVSIFASFYFIFSLVYITLKEYKIIEPYIYTDVSLIYNKEEIEDAMDDMITNVSSDLTDISNHLFTIRDRIDNPPQPSDGAIFSPQNLKLSLDQLPQNSLTQNVSLGKNMGKNMGKKVGSKIKKAKNTKNLLKKKKKKFF